jgi:16S rRNA (guanine(527)-N(7))-methyltransferase RsmG
MGQGLADGQCHRMVKRASESNAGLGSTAESAWRDVWSIGARIPGGLDPEFPGRVRRYIEELGRWTEVANLTGYPTEAGRIRELVGGSLLFLLAVPEMEGPLLDIGSGPGVPGLVLALARPDWAVTLVEARRRRATFLRHVIRMLGVSRAEVLEGRAESFARETGRRGRFTTVTVRAVARWSEAEALARPFVSNVGRVVIGLGPYSQVEPGHGLVCDATGSGKRRRFLVLKGESETDVPRGT